MNLGLVAYGGVMAIIIILVIRFRSSGWLRVCCVLLLCAWTIFQLSTVITTAARKAQEERRSERTSEYTDGVMAVVHMANRLNGMMILPPLLAISVIALVPFRKREKQHAGTPLETHGR